MAVETAEAECGAVALTPVAAAPMLCRAVPLIRSLGGCSKRLSASFMRICTCKYGDTHRQCCDEVALKSLPSMGPQCGDN